MNCSWYGHNFWSSIPISRVSTCTSYEQHTHSFLIRVIYSPFTNPSSLILTLTGLTSKTQRILRTLLEKEKVTFQDRNKWGESLDKAKKRIQFESQRFTQPFCSNLVRTGGSHFFLVNRREPAVHLPLRLIDKLIAYALSAALTIAPTVPTNLSYQRVQQWQWLRNQLHRTIQCCQVLFHQATAMIMIVMRMIPYYQSWYNNNNSTSQWSAVGIYSKLHHRHRPPILALT